jgi:hypothetical protein
MKFLAKAKSDINNHEIKKNINLRYFVGEPLWFSGRD